MPPTIPLLRGELVYHVPATPPPACGNTARRTLPWVRNDGGKRTGTNGCAPRAVQIATGLDRRTVERALEAAHLLEFRKRRDVEGFHPSTVAAVLGPQWRYRHVRKLAEPCTTHLHQLVERNPRGRLIARCETHLITIIDSEIHDSFNASDPAFHISECLLGYWEKTND